MLGTLATTATLLAACTGDGPTAAPPFRASTAVAAPGIVRGLSDSLVVGDSARATVEARDAAGALLAGWRVTWTSTAPAILSVTADGAARALAPGTAVVTAVVAAAGKTGAADRVVAAHTIAVRAAPAAPPTPAPVPPSVFIQPGERIQAYVDANPEGTTFRLKAGVHRRQVIVPKRKNVFWGEVGAVLDGEYVAPVAFDTRAATPDSVTVRNLVIEHYVPAPHQGAVQGDNGDGWLIEGNEVRENAQAGIRAGRHTRVLGNRVHHNGLVGIAGYRAHGALVAENEVYANNTSGSDPDTPTGEASGVKFGDTDSLTVRGNYVHHNAGVGIWCDLGCVHVRYEQNTVTDNSHRGIFHEVSYDAVIRGNVVERNQPGGGPAGWPSAGGIVVAASPNVEVTGNLVRDNGDGITALQEDRGRGPRGPYVVENLLVRGNDVRMPRGATGLVQALGDAGYFTGRNNRFEGNRYQLVGNAAPFQWLGAARTEAQWRGYGQDVTGTFTR